MIWPTEIKLKKSANALNVTFDDGAHYSVPAKMLREESPSAEVQGHGGVKPVVVINPAVRLVDAELVGNYAVRLVFDDGHRTGIYSWELLEKLGRKAG